MYFLVIEVAIGEYGNDLLPELFDTTKTTYINGGNESYTFFDEDHEAQIENGVFPYTIILL